MSKVSNNAKRVIDNETYYIEPDALFHYDIKKAVSDYIQETGKSEREALLTLHQILKSMIKDYKERE